MGFIELVGFLVGRRAQKAPTWQLGVRRETEAPLQGPSARRVGISILAPQSTHVEASSPGVGPCLFLACDLE